MENICFQETWSHVETWSSVPGSLDSGEPKCLGAAVRTFGDQVPE